jgi:uncharacterized HAD superfamily protein
MLGRIYVDFDDVLCETARGLAALLEQEFGKTVAFEQITEFNLEKSFSLSATEIEHLMHLGHQPEFLENLPPVPGAVDGLLGWSRLGYEISVVTGRPPWSADASHAWLRKHGLEPDNMVFVDKYGRMTSDDLSGLAISLDELTSLEFCLALEDAPGMATYLVQNMSMPVVVLERPWNADAVIPEKEERRSLHRCRDWMHVLERFPEP